MTDPTPRTGDSTAPRRDLRTAARRHARLRRRRAPDRRRPTPTPPRIASGERRRGASRPGSIAARCCAAATASCASSSCCAAARAPRASAVRVPTDLVVVLDRSGSMAGEPIATALAALRELIAGLADGDRFALVSYASRRARSTIPLEAASRRRARALEPRDRRDRRRTAAPHMSGGLDLGHAVLAEAARARARSRA